MTYSQSWANSWGKDGPKWVEIDRDTIGPTEDDLTRNEIRPVEVRIENWNGSYTMQTWYAMPKERLSLISNELARLRAIAATVPLLDSTLVERDALLNIRGEQISTLNQRIAERDKIITEGHRINLELEGKFGDCSDRVNQLDKQVRKLRRGRKAWMGIAIGVLGGAVAAVILARAL